MDENSIKYVRNNFQLKKENKVIKERIIRDIRKSLWIRKKRNVLQTD